jgi:hypothetical protein
LIFVGRQGRAHARTEDADHHVALRWEREAARDGGLRVELGHQRRAALRVVPADGFELDVLELGLALQLGDGVAGELALLDDVAGRGEENS